MHRFALYSCYLRFNRMHRKQRQKETHHCRDSERHDARVLEKHSRRQQQSCRRTQRAGHRDRSDLKGPLREDDREQQIQVVEGFAAQGVSGIVLAPLDNRALVRPVADARRAGVPTVIIDSGLESDEIVSFVATDNRKGGTRAADRMGQLLGGKGKVLVLRYAEGSASTTERESGFIEQIKAKFPDIEIVSMDQYAGATRDTAKRAGKPAESIWRSGAGIFTPNESSTAGMLLALEDIGKAGKVSFVGFDVSQRFIDALNSGQLHGIVVQNPFNMGYLGVKTMVDNLLGRTVEKKIDTGVMLVTKENMESPEVKTLLRPPLDQYLK